MTVRQVRRTRGKHELSCSQHMEMWVRTQTWAQVSSSVSGREKTYPGRWSDASFACTPTRCFLCICPGGRWNSTHGSLCLARAMSRGVTIEGHIMNGVSYLLFVLAYALVCCFPPWRNHSLLVLISSGLSSDYHCSDRL